MSIRLKPYPKYKDSGLPWLGEVPKHWGCVPLRRGAHVQLSNVDKHTVDGEVPVRLCNYTDVYYRRFITPDIEFMQASAHPREINKFELRKGDVLITKDSESCTDIAVPAYVTTDLPGVLCGYHLAQLRPYGDTLMGAYLLRAFQAEPIACQFRVAATGVTRFAVSGTDIASGVFPVPPQAEQEAIATFLAHVDRRINRLIRAKRRLIELLNEQKQAIIHQAVTRGLDPTVRLKSSGIDWLGDVPEHWEATRLKHVAEVQTGVTLGKNYGASPLQNRPYLRVANVQDGYLDLGNIATVRVPVSEAAASELQPGDVLMTEGGDIDKLGRGHIWGGEIPGCLHQNHIFAVRGNPGKLRPEFLALLMTSRHGRSYFQITAKQTTNLASTNSTTLKSFPIHLPDIGEQHRLLDHIGQESASLDAAITRARREIDLLSEYRTRLIADVVTGKLDVRGVELPPLDEVEALADLDSGEAADAEEVAEGTEAGDGGE